MPRRRLLRGGKLDHVRSASEIEAPGTIVNLRRGPDRKPWLFGADEIHIPANDGIENYETCNPVVRRWLNRVVRAIASPEVRLPLMLHCTSGKDRTGVATAALLSTLSIDRELIVEEYLLSDGEVRRESIEHALDGLGDAREYFAEADLAALQRRFLQE
ncbi:hypothetical protein DAETH_22470 [Deinococcus aetherius]|uniref:Tyrosine specific protein phosphatases domain-containing protein n=2 Tax=Deinococcus aetherius TaxID=200252 RepID=A0ABN6RJV8_9DEIO|nr:hypothetical protein DAETH_22470 [Deinococcus aetherius]